MTVIDTVLIYILISSDNTKLLLYTIYDVICEHLYDSMLENEENIYLKVKT